MHDNAAQVTEAILAVGKEAEAAGDEDLVERLVIAARMNIFRREWGGFAYRFAAIVELEGQPIPLPA